MKSSAKPTQFTQGGKTFDELSKEFGGDQVMINLEEELAKYSRKYPFEILVKSIVPDGVDVVNKEVCPFVCSCVCILVCYF